MKTIFFGSSNYVLPIIEVLRKNFDLSLVVTTEHLALKGDTLQPQVKVINYCIENKISYLSLKQFNNLTIQQLKTINASIAILADFGLIIPEEILNLFPKGIINIHPSLLPKYRGPTPVQTAILNGDKTTGVSIMKLDGEIDHGPILAQEKETILDTDTAESLYKRLFAKGANLLPETIGLYLDDNLKIVAQNHAKATFTTPLTRQSGFFDISKIKDQKSKTELERKIRAYFPWPGVWTKWKMKNGKWKILKFLPENKLQVEGKKPMSYKDFMNGYSEAKGIFKIL